MKQYDRAYFDKWYRVRRSQVTTRSELERKVAMVVATTEFVLGRRVGSVLDVGCGEGSWQPILQKLRPGSRYAGIDSSAYAVERYGRRRNIRLGSFGALDRAGLDDGYDLIVCCDVLHYLAAAELRSGLPVIADHLDGVSYLEAYTRSDQINGDMDGFIRRAPSAYRRVFHQAGLVAIGMQCYVPESLLPGLTALELPAAAGS
jgi:SAM-dependent methyltransferase